MMNRCYRPTGILLPDFQKTDARRWATVACDQFTSEPAYWDALEDEIGSAPSTLRMILPEARLEKTNELLPSIHGAMSAYLKETLIAHENAMVYVERMQSNGTIRRGIVLAIDLACYDYAKGASSLIRATEATVVERIPPRVAIRRGAALELPHVMLLIDDPQKSVIEPLSGVVMESAYDTDLMAGGGHLKGSWIPAELQENIALALDALITPEQMKARYGDPSLAPLLFAVGDGNHSLASAKAAFEELRQSMGDAAMEHPARYALAEIVNIHDEALQVEPIYRVVFDVDVNELSGELRNYAATLTGTAQPQSVEYVTASGSGVINFPSPVRQLTVGTLQDFLDDYLKRHPQSKIDYIHGIASVRSLTKAENTIGFLFSGMEKDQLFRTVIYDGALPRKTFSMGHAEDKRYYMECRRITIE